MCRLRGPDAEENRDTRVGRVGKVRAREQAQRYTTATTDLSFKFLPRGAERSPSGRSPALANLGRRTIRPVQRTSAMKWLGAAAAAALLALAEPVAAARADTCGAPTNIHECSQDPPTASFTWSPGAPHRRDFVTFTGTAAANPDRALKSTRWDLFDDGEFSDGTTLTAKRHFYAPGSYTVRLRVEDDHGAVTTAVQTVTVAEAEVPMPPRPRASVALQANTLRDGYIPARAPAPPLKRLWSRKLGARISYAVMGGGRIFAGSFSRDVHGSRVTALSRSGRVLWSRIVPVKKELSPDAAQVAYDGGRLFAVGATGLVVAFDAASGRGLWAVQQQQDLFPPALLAYDGIVWSGGNGIGGTTYALRAADGRLLWYKDQANVASAAAIDANNLYLSGTCEGLWEIDRFNGYGLWWHQGGCGGGSGGPPPVVHQGKVWGLSDKGRTYD